MVADRLEPPFAADERQMLTSWLEWHRTTLAMKCEGLTPDQLRARLVPPSHLSLLGLVRHMAEVELGWFRRGVAGEDVRYHWVTDEREDAEFDDVETADVEEAFDAWQASVRRSREIVDAVSTLDQTFHRPSDGAEISLRWVLCHMIEEYARHNGHADLLRERADGSVGE
jgi:uncharacterized damage-inducible protein DinB